MRNRMLNAAGRVCLLLGIILCSAVITHAATAQPLSSSSGYKAFQTRAGGAYSTWDSAKKALSCDELYAFRILPGSDSSSTVLKGSPLSKAVEYKNSNGERDNLGNIKTTWQFKLKNSGSNKGAVRVKYTNYYWYAPKHEKALRSGSMAGYVKLDIVAELCSADYVKHKKPLNNTLSPYFTLSKKAYAGMTRLNTFNIGTLEMKYSYYFSGTDTPAEITSNFTYLDIDWGQAMSFRADGIKKSAVPSNSKLSYKEEKGWHFFSNYAYNVAKGAANPENGVSIAYKTRALAVRYHSDQIVEKAGKKTYKEGAMNGARSFYGPQQDWSLIRFETPDPQKTVSSSEKNNVTDLDLPDLHQSFTFNCSQEIPAGYHEGFYFKSFVLRDTLDSCLVTDISKIRIQNRGGKDLSSLFRIETDGRNITATCTDVNNTALYGNGAGETITLHIEASVRHDVSAEELRDHKHFDTTETSAEFPNRFSAVIDGRERFSNKVSVRIHFPQDEKGRPGLAVNKTTEPYEFQVGDEVPYRICIWQTNSKASATCVRVRDTDLPANMTIDPKTLKAAGINREFSLKAVSGGFEFTTPELRFGETVTITFSAVPGNALNGTVVPNIVRASADTVPERSASTSVYINSPKLNIEKKSVQEKAEYEAGDTVQFTADITNINPGTFMRNIVLVDTLETPGLTLDPDSLKITGGDGTALTKGTDYLLYPYKEGADRVAGQELKTSAQSFRNSGETLPRENYGGFVIRFLGKYANIGYRDGKEPASSDSRGSKANYLKREHKTDYQDLNLKNGLHLSYAMTVDESELPAQQLRNFVRAPATDNTNGIRIKDQDTIPSGGDFSETGVNFRPKTPLLVISKKSDRTLYKAGEKGHYTIKLTQARDRVTAKNIIIKDAFEQRSLGVCDPDSIRVKKGDQDITASCDISADHKAGTCIIRTHTDLSFRETLTVTYDITFADKIPAQAAMVNRAVGSAENAEPAETENRVGFIGGVRKIIHSKTVRESVTSKNTYLHYTLTTKALTPLRRVIIMDHVMTDNLRYDPASVKVLYNGRDITKSCGISFGLDHFQVETRRDAQPKDSFRITYRARATNGRKVKNISAAYATDVDPVKAEANVPPKSAHTPTVVTKHGKTPAPATGDRTTLLLYVTLAVISFGIITCLMAFRRN